MKITEKAAYLKGLADGLELDTATKEGKLIAALLDMVDAMAQKIDEMDHDIAELNDYIEEIDEDLGEVEEYLCEEDECDCDFKIFKHFTSSRNDWFIRTIFTSDTFR